MANEIYLVNNLSAIKKADFPVIDAHNHLWSSWQVKRVINTMDEVGVVSYCDLASNVRIEFSEGGYVIKPGNISDFVENCSLKYPGRFYCFTMSNFEQSVSKPLFADYKRFVAECIETMYRHVQQGAVSLNIPFLIHQADPTGFFDPVTNENEDYESLKKYLSWSFADPKFSWEIELLQRRDELISQYPNTAFILPHFVNYAKNIPYASKLLTENPNVYIDFSARFDESGRHPYSSREFFIEHQDRIIFGTDMPAKRGTKEDLSWRHTENHSLA